MMYQATKKESRFFKLLLVTIFFNIWFPKAGIKISGIPFTIGNIMFALTFIMWIFLKFKNIMKFNKTGILILFGILYFLARLFLSYFINLDFEHFIGFIIPLIVYPLIFYIIIDTVDSKEKVDKIVKIIVYGFFFLSIYALMQYIFGIDKVAIPGITVNLTDYKEYGKYWFLQKANGTTVDSAKIVGTYQNGNLFGISLILIYPLVYYYLKQNNKKNTLIVSLLLFIVCVFLTLSRACWLGIVLFIIIEIILKKSKTIGAIISKIMIVSLCIAGIFFALNYMPSISERFFGTDAKDWISMSGRTQGIIDVFNSINDSNSIVPYIIGPQGIINYSGLAYEMLPLSLFAQSGIIGVILLYAVFLKTIKDIKCNSYVSKAIRVLLIIWLIVGIIECGYWLPPAALNIFMLIGLGYSAKELEKEK